ncbi:MAG: NUDIX domain-containing protein [Flavobacteriales bacterium]
MMVTHFNIRVYGLLMNDQDQVLVSDEFCSGQYMTKFPGGGLEFGEGLIDGLKREFQEELNIDIFNIQHFYTTDFFQVSAFKPSGQLISVYYTVRTFDSAMINNVSFPFETLARVENSQVFRWINLQDLNPEDMTWPVDRHVVKLLKQRK